MTVVAIGQDYRLIEPNIIFQPTICSLLIHLSNDDLGAMPDPAEHFIKIFNPI
jgi:hypothetical protein